MELVWIALTWALFLLIVGGTLLRRFPEMGVEIDTAVSNTEAAAYARSRSYDLVISDIDRSSGLEDNRAGLALPSVLRGAGGEAPVAYYVSKAKQPQTESGEPVFDAPSKLLAHVETQLSGRRRVAAA